MSWRKLLGLALLVAAVATDEPEVAAACTTAALACTAAAALTMPAPIGRLAGGATAVGATAAVVALIGLLRVPRSEMTPGPDSAETTEALGLTRE